MMMSLDLRTRITLWYLQTILTINRQQKFTFKDIVFITCPRQRRDIKHISHFKMFQERCSLRQ